MDPNTIIYVVLTVVAFVLSLSVHEWAHAATATRFGDDTPLLEGRVTLNPAAHIDPIGSLVMPVVGALFGGFLVGWARPVRYRPGQFRRDVGYKKGSILVALAGPASNVVLMIACAIGLKVMLMAFGGVAQIQSIGFVYGIAQLMSLMVFINLVLAVFNMMPVPPLDGFALIEHNSRADSKLVAFMKDWQLIVFLVAIFLIFRIFMGPALILTHLLMDGLGIVAEWRALMPTR